MGERRYLRMFGAGLVLWLSLFLAFTWTIDPYRISPFRHEFEGVNRYKPKLKDIDRPLKPFEVWRNAPRTIFLGTSRIHQSMDPSVLDGTRFAPAYNASIPASSLEVNVSHLRQYLRIDPNLKTVIVELLLYNFIHQRNEEGHDGWLDFLGDAAALALSSDAFWASAQTVFYNAQVNQPCPEIRPGGWIDYPYRRVYSPANQFFRDFLKFATSEGIWAFHGLMIRPGNRFELQESAFDAVNAMVRLCKERGVRIIFAITPSHAQSDYYLDTFGGPDLQVEWLQRLTAVADVCVFPLPVEVEYEPIRYGMRYWNDPMHFSLEAGRDLLTSLARSGIDWGSTSDPSVVRLTPETVKSYVAQRQSVLRQWVAQNPEFTAAFEAGRREWELKNRPAAR